MQYQQVLITRDNLVNPPRHDLTLAIEMQQQLNRFRSQTPNLTDDQKETLYQMQNTISELFVKAACYQKTEKCQIVQSGKWKGEIERVNVYYVDPCFRLKEPDVPNNMQLENA